jgi:hypothetical protein
MSEIVAATWDGIKPGMILKAEDDRNYIWSLVLSKTPKQLTLITYYQLMPRFKGKGYAGRSGTGVDYEVITEKQWFRGGYAMWYASAFPNAIRRPFIKKMFIPEDLE